MKTWKACISFPSGQVTETVQAPDQQSARAMIEAMYGKGSILSSSVSPVSQGWQMINEKHCATKEEIREALLEMRNSHIENMILIWNTIAERWSVDSVSQVHKSLHDSGHIHLMVDHIIKNKDVIEAVSQSLS